MSAADHVWTPSAGVLVAIVYFLLFPAAHVDAQTHPSEFQVKAAYLYNFGKFVRWQIPPVNATSFDICILGKDPFGPVLDSTVAGETIDGKQIKASRLDRPQEAAHCSVLYVAPSEEARLSAILSVVQRMKVLTVSDVPEFCERGGIIGLVKKDDKVRFEVNRAAADRAQLVLSSELLKVATKVIDKPVPGN